MDSFYTYKETKIPVRIITVVKSETRPIFRTTQAHGQGGARSALASLLIVGLMFGTASQAALTGAEAHVVSVTARILQGEESPVAPQPQTDGQVVLNEILPNPEGPGDNQEGLEGEWVELYNLEDFPVDVAGWYLKDASASGNRQTISAVNTHTGSTFIGAAGSGQEWLVVFMNRAVLNNDGDTVFLFNTQDTLKDSHAFGESETDREDSDSHTSPGGDNDAASGSETAGNEGKSIARIPDGTGAWVDPIPTPGGPNRMEPSVSGGGGSGTPAETPAETEEPIAPSDDRATAPSDDGAEPPATTEEPPATTEIPTETPVETEPADLQASQEPPVITEEPVVTEEPPATTEEPTEPPVTS